MTAEELLKSDVFFMRQAVEEAREALRQGEIPIGAVVVCRDRIIAHAEMQAITSAANYLGGKYLSECTLYVTVEPCVMCAGAIGWAQVRRIVYGCADEKRGYQRFAPKALHPKATVVGGVMEEECRQMMQNFFRERR